MNEKPIIERDVWEIDDDRHPRNRGQLLGTVMKYINPSSRRTRFEARYKGERIGSASSYTDADAMVRERHEHETRSRKIG